MKPGKPERRGAKSAATAPLAEDETATLKRDLAEARGQAAEASVLRGLAREANEKLILATIRAQELAEVAEVAQTLAEATALKLHENEITSRAVAEFRERLIGEVGHDLQGPLSSILAAAAVLLEREPTLLQKEVLTGVQASCNRMLAMVSQLLDLTQARLGGGIQVRPVPGDLAAIVWAMVDEIERAHPGRRLQLDAPASVEGHWDASRLGRVIANLLDNALRHGAPGEPVKVAVHRDGEDAVIEVENQGPPILPELLVTLFQPFRRGPIEPVGRTGLGLGLFISHETVRAHGGTLTVESSPQGTTLFRVRLPRSGPPPEGRPAH